MDDNITAILDRIAAGGRDQHDAEALRRVPGARQPQTTGRSAPQHRSARRPRNPHRQSGLPRGAEVDKIREVLSSLISGRGQLRSVSRPGSTCGRAVPSRRDAV